MVSSSIVRRHATGATLVAFFSAAALLSVAPVPAWLRPLDALSEPDPLAALVQLLLARPASIPLPDQQEDQRQAERDPLLPEEDDEPAAPEIPPGPRRGPAWVPPERPALDRYQSRLGLVAPPVERPEALEPYFVALSRVEAGEAGAFARALHFGDSLIASDKIADRVRQRLQERFGSGGRGFLFPKRFNTFQRGQRSGEGSSGWSLDVITSSIDRLPDRHFGFSGASFTASARGETLRFAPLAGSDRLRVHFFGQPGGAELSIEADGAEVGTVSTAAAEAKADFAPFSLPPGTEALTVTASGPKLRLYGVSLEGEGGALWSTLGLPGATSEVWLRPDPEGFGRLLAAEAPDLVVVMLGGNDGLMLSKGRVGADDIERDTDAFVGRLAAGAGEAACLLVSPLEAVRAKAGGRSLVPKPEVPVVIERLRRVAERRGCAFWDMYAAMGGRGSLARWVEAKLMLGDLIHPKSRGSDLLGELMVESLMRAYDEWAERGG